MRNLVALHFARGLQTLIDFERSFQNVYSNQVNALATRPESAEAFRRRFGICPAGPEGRQLGAQEVLSRTKLEVNNGDVFRLAVERLFDRVVDRLQHRDVEILTPAPASGEFLVGDVPALTVRSGEARAGVMDGIPLDHADAVVLPLAPRLLASLGSGSGYRAVPQALVDWYHKLQVTAALEYVCYRPGAAVATQVAAWRPLTGVTVP